MKITDLKGAIIGNNICLRVVTDAGIDGYSQVEEFKDFLFPNIEYYKKAIVGTPMFQQKKHPKNDRLTLKIEPTISEQNSFSLLTIP